MKSFLKIFSVVFLVLLAGVVALSAVTYVAVRETGFVDVRVRDRREGVTIRVPVPVLPVHAAASVAGAMPVRITWSDPEMEDFGSALHEALAELEHSPDATLLQVDDGRDRVLIRKQNGDLIVNVDDGWDSQVRVSIPLATARRVAWALR